jgi:hypothetical protein
LQTFPYPKPVPSSISLVEQALAKTRQDIANDTAFAETLEGYLAHLKSQIGVAEAEEPSSDMSATSDDDEAPDLETQITQLLGKDGPTTLPVMAGKLGMTYAKLYNFVSKGPGNMRARGKIVIAPKRPHKVTLNPDYVETDEDRVRPFLDKIVSSLRASDPDASHPIVRQAAEMMARYTLEVLYPRNNGQRRQAGRIWGVIRKYGLLGGIVAVVTGREKSGLHALRALGYEHLTAEAIVIKFANEFPNVFTSDIVEAAKNRLQ